MELLEKIGLTKGESKVYLALLRIGKSRVGSIIKEAKVSNSKVYDILDRLAEKGLVGVAIEKGAKTFTAMHPNRLQEFIKLKEQELQTEKKSLAQALPQLQELYASAEKPLPAEILEGTRGIKTFCELWLKNLKHGEEIYILGAPKEAEILIAYLTEWHERRVKKKVLAKILYNEQAKHLAEKRKKMELTEVRYLPKEIKTDALIDISDEYVATLLFFPHPLCVVIRNKRIAASYKSYFSILWNQANTNN